MTESVVFSYRKFAAMFPELKMSEQQATTAFWLAEGIVNNTSHSVIRCECDRERLLYLLTAHILFLQNRGGGNIGTLTGAHEGSVGVNYSTASVDKLGAGWFGQTQYGLLFWQMSAKYLSGYYVP